jgi:ATP/maltotriose-dependent transcriptional regulator MalT
MIRAATWTNCARWKLFDVMISKPMLRDHQTPPSHAEHRTRIARPRLEDRLFGPGAAPVTIVVGPRGSGKSELLRPFRNSARAIYFRAGNEHGTFARFVHGLAYAVAPVAPGAHASFPRAWERALQSGTPGVVLAHWLCEHLAGIDRHIVIDDLHEAAADPSIASFIGRLAELRPNTLLTIAARSVGALPVALWMATRRMEQPIDEAELRFDRLEMIDLARRLRIEPEPKGVDELLAATGGLPIAVAYALTRLRDDPREFSQSAAPLFFEAIAERVCARRSDSEQAFLYGAALFPNLEDDLLALSGWDDARAMRRAMGSDAAFMWEDVGPGEIRFHDRFRDYLVRQFEFCDPDFRSKIAHQTVHSLTVAGRHADALAVATRQRLTGAMSQLLDKHGFEILESGQVDVISETLEAFDAPEITLGARAVALRGYLDARRGHLDTAEAWFRLGLDRADNETTRVSIAMYYARELALRRRDDACDVLAPFVHSTTLPRSILIDVRSSFGQALTAANRLDEAAACTDEALALLEPNSAPALRARVFARAAYVANECGALSLARERAHIAAPLAVANCLYDVAASTYSVLYSIAYDTDDDAAASLAYLNRVRDLGLKSGTLRLEVFALIGMYELQSEAGDENALADLDRQLAAVDKHDDYEHIIESLQPAKALQAGWSGNFDAAARLLRPTAGLRATAARRALCWSQIALYSAANGDVERSNEAFRAAAEILGSIDVPVTQFGLTLLTLALTSWVNGNLDGTRTWVAAAGDVAIGSGFRLRALRTVLTAMIAGAHDEECFADGVSRALAELRAVSFGGMAKLIMALPRPRADAAGEPETVGAALARRELPGRFAVAVASEDAALLRAWLDTLAGTRFDGMPVVERFDRWAAGVGPSNRRTPAAFGKVRAEVAAYRRPARPNIRLVDDIDAAITELFEDLAFAAPLMGEHSRAVSAWCSRIGRVLGLSEREIDFVTRCGLIHDVGKTHTPPQILNAARGLSPDEWAIMRDHAPEGGRMVSRLPALEAFVPIVSGHHERLDGKGYPDGLRLSAIPLAARIVSVADSFNAMIGRRPYRLPLTPHAALDELGRHRGTQFDPEIVEAMVRVVLGHIAEKPTPSLVDCSTSLNPSRSASPSRPSSRVGQSPTGS